MNIEQLITNLPSSFDDLLFPSIIHSSIEFNSNDANTLEDSIITPFIGHLINCSVSLLDSEEAHLHIGLQSPQSLIYGVVNQEDKPHYFIGDFSNSPLISNWINNNMKEMSYKIIDGNPSNLLMGNDFSQKIGVCVYNHPATKEEHLQTLKKIEPYFADLAIVIITDINNDEMRAASYSWVLDNPHARILYDLPTPVNAFPTWGNGIHVIAYEKKATVEVEDRKKEVVLISHSILEGGSEEIILNIAKYLDKKKYHTSVVYLYEGHMGDIFREHGIDCFEGTGDTYESRLNSLKAYLNKIKPNYLLCNYLPDGHFIAPEGTKTIEIGHAPYTWLRQDKRYQQALHKTAKIVSVSSFVQEYMKENFHNLDLEKLIVINNGIDARKITPTMSKEEVMFKYGIPEGCIVLGSLSRIYPAKGLSKIIEAARILNNKYPNLFFIIPGDKHRERKYYKKLQRRIRKYGLTNILFPGFIKDTADILQIYDIFIFPSRNVEGLQLALVEAVKMGLPIVTTNVGVVRFDQDMLDGEVGFVINDITPELLAEKLSLLIENEELRKQIGTRNKEVFKEKYTALEMVKQYEEILEQLE